MGEILDVELGYVTTRRGARLHLVADGGRAYCNSGTGRIITSRKARGDDAAHVCKRCRAALRRRLVDVLNVRSRRATTTYGVPGNAAIVRGCEALIDGMMTQDEIAERDAMLDNIRRNLTTAYETAIAPKPIRPIATSSESDQPTLF